MEVHEKMVLWMTMFRMPNRFFVTSRSNSKECTNPQLHPFVLHPSALGRPSNPHAELSHVFSTQASDVGPLTSHHRKIGLRSHRLADPLSAATPAARHLRALPDSGADGVEEVPGQPGVGLHHLIWKRAEL